MTTGPTAGAPTAGTPAAVAPTAGAPTDARPVPFTQDHDTAGLFEHAARGQLAVRVCSCGRVSHLPTAYCHQCGSFDGEWTPVSGTARVITWTRVTHQLHPAFPTPYTIILVGLEEHPEVHMFGHLPGEPAVEDGQLAEVHFEELGDGVHLPQWRLVP